MERAKQWAKRVWGWIDNISTATWLMALVGGGTVLGLLYSFVAEFRGLPTVGQAFFDLAIFAAAALTAIVVSRRFLTPHFAEPSSKVIPTPDDEPVADEVAALKSQLDRERNDKWKAEAEAVNATKKAVWADELIEKERRISLFEITRAALWHQEGLKTDEPYFEIGIIFRYSGNLRLILNAVPPIGHIALSGEEFALEPTITTDWKQELPFSAVGPTGGIIRIRQRLLTKERAESLRKRLRLNEPELKGRKLEIEMNFLGVNLWLWMKSRFEDEPVRDGRVLPEHLTLEYMIEA